MQDADRESKMVLLKNIVRACLEDEGNLLGLSTTVESRKRKLAMQWGVGEIETLSSMRALPEAFRVDVIAHISDMNTQDVLNAKKRDSEVDRHLLVFSWPWRACEAT